LQGKSPAIQHLKGQIQRIAPYFRTAMLTGERYCGDVAVATALHQLSPFSHRPLVTLSATDAELMLGESFPSPIAAEAGMLLITWPERLSRSAQMTLLRLLRNRRPTPPRIVVFAEHGLRPLVSTGNFSPDLEATLGALRIHMPALRDRREDVPALLQASVHDAALRAQLPLPQLTTTLLEAAAQHSWPGNLRDLRMLSEWLVQHASELAATEAGSPESEAATVKLDVDVFAAALESVPSGPPVDRRAVRLIRLDQVIQEHVRAVLLACNGNKLRAAEILGISRSTLYRMLESPQTPSQTLSMAG
jgi:two-component system response regulator HydG